MQSMKLTENSNLRFNGSKTITRPVTMEHATNISPDGKSLLGNPN
jgi:hypothetical protein